MLGIHDISLKLYYPKLRDLVRQRNECAHGDAILSFPSKDASEIVQFAVGLHSNAIGLMGELLLVMADFLEKEKFFMEKDIVEASELQLGNA
jgi:hypothetical protein